MRHLLVADLHLLPGEQPAQNRDLAALLARAAGCAGVWFLGDLLNFWWERGERHVGDYDEVLGLLRRAAETTPLHHLAGNRDFTAGPRLAAAAGLTCHGAEHCLSVGARRVLLSHGDACCTRDLGYQALRWLLTGPVGRLLRRVAPWGLATRIVGGVQGRKKLPSVHLPAHCDLQDRAVGRALARREADLYICGHLHREEHRVLERPGRDPATIHLLPAWSDTRRAALLDEAGLTVDDAAEADRQG
jgi:UDP-2,3-diacylglucosamine hydrolase